MGTAQSCHPDELPYELAGYAYEQEVGELGDVVLTQINFNKPVQPGIAFVCFVDGQFVWITTQWDPRNRRILGTWGANATEEQKTRVKQLLTETGAAEALEAQYHTQIAPSFQ